MLAQDDFFSALLYNSFQIKFHIREDNSCDHLSVEKASLAVQGHAMLKIVRGNGLVSMDQKQPNQVLQCQRKGDVAHPKSTPLSPKLVISGTLCG